MTLSFFPRLVLLSAAAFFLAQLTLAALAAALAPAAYRLTRRMAPGPGADVLLALRLAPSLLGLLLVLSLAVPGYLRLEPANTAEQGSVACWCAALSGIAIWTFSIARTCRAAIRSRHCSADWFGRGREAVLPGETEPVWLVDSAAPILAVIGILHPRVCVSRVVVTALSPRQLATALRHERAHRRSGDNLKRLLMMLAPGVLPGWRGLDSLERGWARLAEWAADDRAIEQDSKRSVLLAEALIRVARLGNPKPVPVLAMSISHDSLDLAERVERLIAGRSASCDAGPRVGMGLLAVVAGLAAAATQPSVLLSVHRWLERLMD